MAHVRMLGRVGVLTPDEADAIVQGLRKVKQRIDSGEVSYSVAYEDIHMNIEKMLTDEIGPLGGKLHTGRSRNDQVALDLHLYVKRVTVQTVEQLARLQEALLQKAEEHVDTILPGYTHLQRAQPIRLAHHMLAYVAMFGRDIERLQDSYKRADCSPLGAGALAGTTFPLDRKVVAEELGFSTMYDNSLDCQRPRFYRRVSECRLFDHGPLSRMGEELVLWSD